MNIIIRHNKDQLKESLTTEDLILVLKDLGAENFNDEIDTKGQLVTNTICHNQSNGSMKLYYKEDIHSFKCFTGCSCSYDIYSLVIKVFENRGQTLSFTAAVDYVARTCGRSFGFGIEIEARENENEEMQWMQRVSKKPKIQLPQLTYYNEAILDVFSHHNNPSILINDHIKEEALNHYGIRYYNKASRIVFVNRHWENGKIIGLRGRYIGVLESEMKSSGIAKYAPLVIQQHIYSFPTMMNLFSLWESKMAISRLGKIIIFESEKSVLQCFSYFGEDCYAVALSGSSLSQRQIDIILSIEGLTEIQIAMDCEFQEGDRDSEVRQMQKVLQMARRFTPFVRTTVLWNSAERLIGFKESPSDRGRDVLLKMLEQKQEVLNKE